MNTQEKIDALNAQFAMIHAMAIDTGVSMNAALDLIEAQIWTLKAQLQNENDDDQARRDERKLQRQAIEAERATFAASNLGTRFGLELDILKIGSRLGHTARATAIEAAYAKHGIALDDNESIEPVSVEVTDNDVLHATGYYKAVAAITGKMNHCDAVRGSNAFHGIVKQALELYKANGIKPTFNDLSYSGLNGIKASVFEQLDNMNLVTLL